MPGALDGLATATAPALINRLGKTATLTRVTKTQNQATGIATETTTTESVIITPPEPFEERRWPSLTVQDVQSVASVAAQEVAEPNIGDRLTIDGLVMQVVDKAALYSGNLVALWIMGLRA